MSTRSSSSNLVPPSTNPESIIRNRRQNLGDPSRLLDFEEINMANDPNNVQGPPPVGPNFQNPNPDLRSMKELLQAPTDGVVPPSTNLESIIQNRRRNLGDPSRLLDFEEINMANNPNNVHGRHSSGCTEIKLDDPRKGFPFLYLKDMRCSILLLDDFSSILFIIDFLFLTGPSEIETFLSFPSRNEDKIVSSYVFSNDKEYGESQARDSYKNKRFSGGMYSLAGFTFDRENLRACFQSSNHSVSDHLHVYI
ncbi:hypothetical protein Tco_0256360 [Tanacetum coccineum]